MRISVANRDNIVLNEFDLLELKQYGVEAVELYLSPNDPRLLTKISQVADAGLEPVVHFHGPVGFLLCRAHLESLQEVDRQGLVRILVVHPVEGGRSQSNNHIQTHEVLRCWRKGLQLTICLENLPYDARATSRYGKLWQVTGSARACDVQNCFDTGHYLSEKAAASNFVTLTAELAARIAHLHVHAFVSGKDHHPLCDDDGLLLATLQEFRGYRPDYNGFYSIEVIPFSHKPTEAIVKSIDWLKENFA